MNSQLAGVMLWPQDSVYRVEVGSCLRERLIRIAVYALLTCTSPSKPGTSLYFRSRFMRLKDDSCCLEQDNYVMALQCSGSSLSAGSGILDDCKDVGRDKVRDAVGLTGTASHVT